jgi:hypothetical protein
MVRRISTRRKGRCIAVVGTTTTVVTNVENRHLDTKSLWGWLVVVPDNRRGVSKRLDSMGIQGKVIEIYQLE